MVVAAAKLKNAAYRIGIIDKTEIGGAM